MIVFFMASSHGSKYEDLINPEKNIYCSGCSFMAPETLHINISFKYQLRLRFSSQKSFEI